MNSIFKFKYLIIIFLTAGFLFYWYGLRPSYIRKECSWIIRHIEAIPADPGTSQEEAERATKNCIDSGARWSETLHANLCSYPVREPTPAIPARDIIVKASLAQYTQCIHSKGLRY